MQTAKKPVDIDAKLAEFTARGMSQGEMARELGVSRITVIKWLRQAGYQLKSLYVQAR